MSLVKVFKSKNLRYSRLIDDITVSSEKAICDKNKIFINLEIRRMLKEKQLKVCDKKYSITNTKTTGKKTIVTGLVIENGDVKLPKEKVKEIGGKVYTLLQKGAVDTTTSEYHDDFNKVSGLVALYSRLNPVKSKVYRKNLRSVLPTYELRKAKKIGYLCRSFIKYAKYNPQIRDTEGFAKKYYKFKYKINILRRTNRFVAKRLSQDLVPFKPTRLIASHHE